jgi:DNA-binding MarR family transcriptional regulator
VTHDEKIALPSTDTGTASGDPEPASAAATPDDVAFGPLAELAGFMLRLAQLQLFESFFRDFAQRGITPGQIGILIAIGRNPGVRQGVLADALSIKWSNMAKIIRLLEGQGLIERRVPARDRRAVELHLTEAGRAAVDGTVPHLMVSDRAATTALTQRERDTLLRLLAKLARPAGAR